MIQTICTPYTEYEEVIKDLEEGFATLEFKPNVLLVFLTSDVWDIHERIFEFLKRKFPDAKMAGCFVEGYMTENAVWTRGVVVLAIESDGVDVFWAKGGTTYTTFSELSRMIGSGWSSILLMYPTFYFTSRFDMLRAYLTNRYYSLKYGRAKTKEDKERVLREYSRTVESKYVYPINKVLRLMPEPVIGMNLMPMEAKCETPRIFANYESIGRGAVAVCFKGRVNTLFHDIFPERGKSFEETLEILREYFPNTEIVRVVKGGVSIGEVNGVSAVKFLESRVRALRELSKDEAIDRLEGGKFQTYTPYGLAFVSETTFGSSALGLLPYPLQIYPSLFELDNFYDDAVFFGELFRGGIKSYEEIFLLKSFEDGDMFDLFLIDYNVIPMFGKDVHRIREFARSYCTRFLGLISSIPSAKVSHSHRRYMSENEPDIFFNVTGTSAMLEIKSLKG